MVADSLEQNVQEYIYAYFINNIIFNDNYSKQTQERNMIAGGKLRRRSGMSTWGEDVQMRSEWEGSATREYLKSKVPQRRICVQRSGIRPRSDTQKFGGSAQELPPVLWVSIAREWSLFTKQQRKYTENVLQYPVGNEFKKHETHAYQLWWSDTRSGSSPRCLGPKDDNCKK